MNQIKMGKFICECRKDKKMTQEELGNKLGIGGKSVSKWERGVNVPDISILEELSSELGVTINELLNGERIEKENIKDINNTTTIDGIKFYANDVSSYIQHDIQITPWLEVLYGLRYNHFSFVGPFKRYIIDNVYNLNNVDSIMYGRGDVIKSYNLWN